MSNTQLDQLADQLAIRTVLDEYCLRLEVNNIDEWLDLFTDDSVYEVYKLILRGRAELAGILSKAPHGVHVPGAPRITVNGNRAQTIQNYLFISTSTDEWNAGWYFRELVRGDTGWKISRTRVQFARKGTLAEDERARKLAYPIALA
jgi:hypothetical protein